MDGDFACPKSNSQGQYTLNSQSDEFVNQNRKDNKTTVWSEVVKAVFDPGSKPENQHL